MGTIGNRFGRRFRASAVFLPQREGHYRLQSIVQAFEPPVSGGFFYGFALRAPLSLSHSRRVDPL